MGANRFPLTNPAAAAHPSVWQPSRVLRDLHHDLRQPLDTIRALAEDAGAQEGLSETVRSCLARITDEADDLLALCRHVLEGARPAATTHVTELAATVAASCQTATGTTVVVEGDDVVLALDEVDVRRALWNLLENAARAAGPDGRVELTVDGGPDVRLSVGDSGPGFAVGPKGTASLGLAIVRRLAAANNGRVEIGRSHLGGALVRLVLPVSLAVGHSSHETAKSTVAAPPSWVTSGTGQGVGVAALSVLLEQTDAPHTSQGSGEGRA